MCKHCEGGTSKFVHISERPLTQGHLLGDSWGREGFSRARRWVHRAVLVQTNQDKKFRVMTGGAFSAPIEFCPKCGRKLNATS